MVIHYSAQTFCGSEFLVAKIVREIFHNKTQCDELTKILEERFKLPVYLLCEEAAETTKGETEWIRGYISYYEARFEFEILELSHGTYTPSYH